MLIRSSFVSLVLAGSLTSAAHCNSTPESATENPSPTPIAVVEPTPTPTPTPTAEPTPTPTPTATPIPDPEPPHHVNLKLLPDESACEGSYKVSTADAGALTIQFDDLISSPASAKYRAVCRLAGEVRIPKGYRLDPSVALSGVVKGELGGGIDNITGRLKLSVGRYTARDFKLAEYEEYKQKPVKLDLKAQLPEIPESCDEDFTWSVSLFIETTINGGATSRIEELKLDSLKLLPIDCKP